MRVSVHKRWLLLIESESIKRGVWFLRCDELALYQIENDEDVLLTEYVISICLEEVYTYFRTVLSLG